MGVSSENPRFQLCTELGTPHQCGAATCRSVAYTCLLAPSSCMQLLLVVGWQCLLSVSSYCSIQDTSGCLRNWPMIPVEANVLKYYNVELGWYLHLMLKHPLGEFRGWVCGRVWGSNTFLQHVVHHRLGAMKANCSAEWINQQGNQRVSGATRNCTKHLLS